MALRASPPAASVLAKASSRRSLLPPPIRSPPTVTSTVSRTGKRGSFSGVAISRCSLSGSLRMESFWHFYAGSAKASTSGVNPSSEGDDISQMLEGLEVNNNNLRTSFLAKLAVTLGIAATVTLVSVCKWPPSGSSFQLPHFVNSSSQSVPVPTPNGFTLTIFGCRIILPEHTPGWVYFWLLMAAGCGLFISEEALNVWVGISLARNLSLDGNWKSLVKSFSANASYVISTILWVYWGVCISDMIPFYLGKLFRQTKASEGICTKLGIGKEKAMSIIRALQKYGNLIGFGNTLRVLFCWSLLWWFNYSSESVGHWFFAERTTSRGTCKCCNSCGHMDFISVLDCGINSVCCFPSSTWL
ncbi:uncharacterized protein LOC103697102 isoform X2 [Phoenix dactylifera]|uniref:Uncharacterized protein LOC103697102 isoform X2 n=1 Tax=Phoenix dactylifera TaxID=42345 RepID=A0A8B8ZKQ0_PHODC|nr:uncharacterized protein LOC103697102 isoform X2 [Phoenix dactylifera]